MLSNEHSNYYYVFEKAYLADKEYRGLLAKPDKDLKELKRMEQLYETLRREAPHFLEFYD